MTNQELYTDLANCYGTPLYVYDSRIILAQIEKLKSALAPLKPTICYAVKALSTLAILRLLHEAHISFDIVSEGELRRLQRVGVDPQNVVFSGVGKTDSEIEYALTNRIRAIQVESLAELDRITVLAERNKLVAPVSFRINPAVNPNTHQHLATGLATSKFGIAIKTLLANESVLANNRDISIVGISCHIGSNITSAEPFAEAFEQVMNLYKRFSSNGFPLEYVDFGGGLGVSYGGYLDELDLTSYANAVRLSLGQTTVELLLEPGKFIVAESGTLLTRALYCKENGGQRYVVVDAGMNDLIRPAMYDAKHPIVNLDAASSQTDDSMVDVVGPVCESSCLLGRNRMLGPVNAGNLLAIAWAGAYGSSMSSNYNSRRLAAEVMIYPDGSAKLIRKRQEWDTLWQDDLE